MLRIKPELKDYKYADLTRDCKLWLTSYAKAYTKVGADTLTKEARIAMERFYSEYSPTYYIRTDNLKNKSYQRYYHNNGRKHYGGVKINSIGMSPYSSWSGDPYPASSVVEMGWNGFHGHWIKGSSPLDYLTNIYESVLLSAEANEAGLKAASSQNYSVIEFK